MNTKWESVDIWNSSNSDHFNINKNILAQAKLCPAIVENCAAILADYEAKLQKEDEVLVLSQKEPFSKEMREKDEERDQRYVNVSETVHTMMKYPFENISGAAARVNECLKLYKLDIRYNINKETGVMDNLLQELQGPLAADIETLRLTEIVALMAAANAETNRLYIERFVANANKVNEQMKTARKNVDGCYMSLREKVNALVVVFGAEQYSDFLGFVNQYIIDIKRRVLKQTAKPSSASDGDTAGTENAGDGNTDTEDENTNTGGNTTGGDDNNNNGGGTTTPPGSVPMNPSPGGDDPDL